jgi:hypothetical protein
MTFGQAPAGVGAGFTADVKAVGGDAGGLGASAAAGAGVGADGGQGCCQPHDPGSPVVDAPPLSASI